MNQKKSVLIGIFVTVAILITPLIISINKPLSLFKNPVLFEGRIQPLDSVARNTLLVLNNKTRIKYNNKKISYQEWFSKTINHDKDSKNFPIFYISSKQIKHYFKLKKRRSSFEEIKKHIPEIQKQSEQAKEVPVDFRSKFQKDIIDLNYKISFSTQKQVC